MAPDVKFHLSHDAFDRFVALLSSHGVGVRDDTGDFGQSSASLDCRRGVLMHEGRDFQYRRQKVLTEADFPWSALPQHGRSLRMFRHGHLSVDIVGQPSDAVERLCAVLEQVFPDPPEQQASTSQRHG